jgi:type I restriction enzyme R subunit
VTSAGSSTGSQTIWAWSKARGKIGPGRRSSITSAASRRHWRSSPSFGATASFADLLLEHAIKGNQNRAIETAQVIEELIALDKQVNQASARGEALHRSDDELAFYDALEANDSAVKVLGDETLRTIARELVANVRRILSIAWMVRENVRAQLRVIVKSILRKHGNPPDKQEQAIQAVLEQAEVLSIE